MKTASVRWPQPQALGPTCLGPRLSWADGSADPGGGALAGSTPFMPAWHCQPLATNLSLQTPPHTHPVSTPTPAQPSDLRPCPMQTPTALIPSPPPGSASRPAAPQPHHQALPSCPERSRGLVSGGDLSLPHHEDVCSDGPVRKQQRLPDKDADLPRKDQNSRQETLTPAASGGSLPPACWQRSLPPLPLGPASPGSRLTRNLWLMEPGPQPQRAPAPWAGPGQSRAGR